MHKLESKLEHIYAWDANSYENTDILIKTSISHQSSTLERNLKSLSTRVSSATIHIS